MFRLLLALLIFQFGKHCESLKCNVKLRIDTGWVCGATRYADNETSYASFRGVPYAKPAVGTRRFKELEPRDPWDGVYDATKESPACPQKDLIYGRLALHEHGESEDCIYLNLHVPSHALPKVGSSSSSKNETTTTTGLPILVMIHGGAFQAGSGLTDMHGPEYLIPKEVIVITFNYRINVFGFLSLRTKEVPGNQGIRDQVTLLRWVQRNARAFGGDPDNVTVMGQSAGATCAHILSLSNVTSGLFKRIVLKSATALTYTYSASPTYAKQVADAFISYTDINSTDAAVVHQSLIEMPLNKIMKAFTYVQKQYGNVIFAPVVEDEYTNVTRILDDDPFELIARGRGKNYPTVVGFANNELEFFRWLYTIQDAVTLVNTTPTALLFPYLVYSLPVEESTQLAEEVFEWCINGNITLDKLLQCQTITLFKYPAFKLAQWRAITGAPTYLYEFSYEGQYSVIKQGLWMDYSGATHVEDLTYIFRSNSILGDSNSDLLNGTDILMTDWVPTLITNFAKCSSPTCSSNESDWPAVSMDQIVYQSIAEPGHYKLLKLAGEEEAAVEFLDGISTISTNITERLMEQRTETAS